MLKIKKSRTNMKSDNSPPLWKKIIFSGITIILFFLFLETIAHFIVPPRYNPTHLEQQRIISVIGLPSLNDIMEFDNELFWVLKKNLRNVRVNGYIGEYRVDFLVTTYDRFRSHRVSRHKNRFRILAVGDSCTFGVGVDDEETWPDQLQVLLTKSGLNAEVINTGVPGYTAFQGKRFLEKKGIALQPDLVVVCFGFNDVDTWASQSDFEVARKMALKRWEGMLMRSRLYYSLKLLLRPFMLGNDNAESPKNVREIVDDNQNGKTNKKSRPRLSKNEFYETLMKIKRLCDEKNIRLIFLIWPYEKQIRRQIKHFVLYQTITDEDSRKHLRPFLWASKGAKTMFQTRFCPFQRAVFCYQGLFKKCFRESSDYVCQKEKIMCGNLVDVFIKAEEPLFIDSIHANPEGCRLVARAVFQKINPMLESR